MSSGLRSSFGKSADKFLLALASSARPKVGRKANRAALVANLISAGLVAREAGGGFELTPQGRDHVARMRVARATGALDPFLGQHLALARVTIDGPLGTTAVLVDEAESPLAWLSRRRGRDGRPLITAEQRLAGERLRLEFTRAQLMPRVSANWQAAVSHGARAASGGRAGHITDVIVTARQHFRRALDAVGPEFSGLLVDVCCFLKGLEDVERERHWPSRSAKVVLQLGLDRLARHYGLAHEAQGRGHATIRAWAAPEES
jgi:hypothetical protein